MEKIGKSLNGYGANKTVILALRKNIPMNDTITEIVKKWCETSNSNIFYTGWDTDLIIVPCFLMIIDRAFGGEPVESSNSSNYRTWMNYVNYCQEGNLKEVDFFVTDYTPIIIIDNFIPNKVEEIAAQLRKPLSCVRVLDSMVDLEKKVINYLNGFKQLQSELLALNSHNADYRVALYVEKQEFTLNKYIFFNNCDEFKKLLKEQNISTISFRFSVLEDESANYKMDVKVDNIDNNLICWFLTPDLNGSKFISYKL
jgi:hypothetical protein